MAYHAIGRHLPEAIAIPLFGDRKRYGSLPPAGDSDWQEWLKVTESFYVSTQRQSVGHKVNDAGYRFLKNFDLAGKTVLEIGAGDLQHYKYWRNLPQKFVVADAHAGMLEKSKERLNALKIPTVEAHLIARDWFAGLPIESNSVDFLVTFYSLEHLSPFEKYLAEMIRVLKPGGRLIGAIPSEGGVAWGLGRYFTSKRWLEANTTLKTEKIVCWEHPNFADSILNTLKAGLKEERVEFWPFHLPLIDTNLIIKFSFVKPET